MANRGHSLLQRTHSSRRMTASHHGPTELRRDTARGASVAKQVNRSRALTVCNNVTASKYVNVSGT